MSAPAVLALALVGSALSACGDGPLPTSADPAPLPAAGAVFARESQVSVCHRTGSGAYRLLSVDGNALAAHQAHGDAAPGAPVPDGPGSTFGADCTPQSVDVTGSYVLATVGGLNLPTQGDGEIMHSATLVLHAGGSCSFSGVTQPGETVESFAFQVCSYSLDGTTLTLDVVDERGEEGVITAQLVEDEIIVEILVRDDADPSDEGVPAEGVFVKV